MHIGFVQLSKIAVIYGPHISAQSLTNTVNTVSNNLLKLVALITRVLCVTGAGCSSLVASQRVTAVERYLC